VFTVAERTRVRERLLELAQDDADVVAAAITGSFVADGGDEWSDIDLALGVRGELAPVLQRWSLLIRSEFGVVHEWDLPFGPTIYRVFLLPDWLQVDIGFTTAEHFGPRGPNWRTVFGETVEVRPTTPPTRDELIGWAWVCARHAHTSIERGRPWQAEWAISAVRDNVLALASLRLGYATRYAKGADFLPQTLTEPLEATLVRSLEEDELRRAHGAAVRALARELQLTEPALFERLEPMLDDLVRP
jgi:hypothetical protein